MVVVLIIGIISAIAIPNLITAMERSRQKRTMSDMRNLATAWEARNVEAGRYNAAGFQVPGITETVGVDQLELALSPTYIRKMPKQDGWDHPLELYTDLPWGSTQSGQGYAIISPGRDGRYQSTATTGATTDFDCDIVFSNGSFLQYPLGAQTATQ